MSNENISEKENKKDNKRLNFKEAVEKRVEKILQDFTDAGMPTDLDSWDHIKTKLKDYDNVKKHFDPSNEIENCSGNLSEKLISQFDNLKNEFSSLQNQFNQRLIRYRLKEKAMEEGAVIPDQVADLLLSSNEIKLSVNENGTESLEITNQQDKSFDDFLKDYKEKNPNLFKSAKVSGSGIKLSNNSKNNDMNAQERLAYALK